MPTALPASTDFTGSAITEAQFKTALTSLRQYLADLLGTTGVLADARTTLGVPKDIQPITASVASSALTVTLNPTILDFRSATLGSGAVNTRTVAAAISVVVPSGATLGAINATQSRIAVVAIDNAGTVELAVVNIAGGNDLSETGLISTTAISAAADASNVVYSTSARSNVSYRVVGYVESTQATAGTWATAPSTIQGTGGQAMAAMSSLGYGQTWQNVTGSRALSTTYYNTTGKTICIYFRNGAASQSQGLVNGVEVGIALPASGTLIPMYLLVPPGAGYSVAGGSINIWAELR